LTPEAGRTEPTVRHDPRTRVKSGGPSASSGPSSPLTALSEASRRYAKLTSSTPSKHLRVSRALPLAAALVVGTAMVFAGRLEHRCAAMIHITGPNAEGLTADCRRALLDYAWLNSAPGGPAESPRRWQVDVPATATLRLSLTAPDRRKGLEVVRETAAGYIADLRGQWEAARATPSAAEQILSQRTHELQRRLQDGAARLEAIQTAAPTGDPAAVRAMLLEQGTMLRSRFAAARSRLAAARDELQGFRQLPLPTYGIVDGSERRDALQADSALQQDLEELQVNLLELQRHLFRAAEEAAESMKELLAACEAMVRTLETHKDAAFAEPGRMTMAAIASEAASYQDKLQQFAEAWTTDFSGRDHLPEDRLADELLDLHERGRALLNDFLFNADRHLGTMRTSLQEFGAGDNPRLYVLQSDLARAFQGLQSAHHRFAFAAEQIEARDNFRLDSALKVARGLRRRTREQIAAIDEQLQKRALERAREKHAEALERAQAEVEGLRVETEGISIELVDLLESLNATLDENDRFLNAAIQTEWAAAQQELAAADFTALQRHLDEVAAARSAVSAGNDLELLDVAVVGRPANLSQRLRTGGLAALCTLLTVGLGQWWLARRG